MGRERGGCSAAGPQNGVETLGSRKHPRVSPLSPPAAATGTRDAAATVFPGSVGTAERKRPKRMIRHIPLNLRIIIFNICKIFQGGYPSTHLDGVGCPP